MNDFTLEELQIIHLDMTNYINRTPMLNEAPSHKALRNKIQTMIHNYCTHEQCGDGAGLEQVCFECNKSSNEGWA